MCTYAFTLRTECPTIPDLVGRLAWNNRVWDSGAIALAAALRRPACHLQVSAASHQRPQAVCFRDRGLTGGGIGQRVGGALNLIDFRYTSH